ncbi:MAG: trypsin-like serine protease [Chloroflexia bacterium]
MARDKNKKEEQKEDRAEEESRETRDENMRSANALPLGFDPGKLDPIVNGVITTDFEDCCAVGDNTRYFCSGTLIAPNLVITAAHCTGATQVFLKGNDVRKPNEGETRIVRKQFAHDTADIRVLVLKKKSSVTHRKVSNGNVTNDDHIRLVGFGNVDLNGSFGFGIKRMAEGVPITSADCSRPNDAQQLGCEPGTEIVAGTRGLNTDTCTGDSGGPLYVEGADGRYYLLGATSRATAGSVNTCGDGGIYTRVDKFVDWIKEKTGITLDREPS